MPSEKKETLRERIKDYSLDKLFETRAGFDEGCKNWCIVDDVIKARQEKEKWRRIQLWGVLSGVFLLLLGIVLKKLL